MAEKTFLPSPYSPSFSEALRMSVSDGAWIFVSGQVGVPVPPTGAQIGFADEVRVCFERIGESLGKLDADLQHIVSIKAYLTDLALYVEFSRIRGALFASRPPTSTAVQVAGLLLGARIEIDAVAFVPGSTA